MLSTFNHYTITTGGNAVRPLNAVNPEIVKRVQSSIRYNLGDTEPCALFPGLDPDTRFLMKELPGGNLQCLVYYKENLQLGFLIARKDGKELHDQLINLMKQTGLSPNKGRLTKIPPAPLCAVALSPKAVYCPSLSWMADFERCAAVAWLREGEGVQ